MGTESKSLELKTVARSDPLGDAYRVLKGNDPLAQRLRRQVWRSMWARNSLNDWFSKSSSDPEFARALHQAIPKGDPELLEEMLAIVSSIERENPIASYIAGLLNERISQCRPSSMAVAKQWLPWADSPGTPGRISAESYKGYACASVATRDGKPAKFVEGIANLPMRSLCRISVWLQPERPEAGLFDEIQVVGIDQDFVTFGFEVDCATLDFAYGRKQRYFHKLSRSEDVGFEFRAPVKSGVHMIYLHIFNGQRLVKSLVVAVRISAPRSWKRSASRSA